MSGLSAMNISIICRTQVTIEGSTFQERSINHTNWYTKLESESEKGRLLQMMWPQFPNHTGYSIQPTSSFKKLTNLSELAALNKDL